MQLKSGCLPVHCPQSEFVHPSLQFSISDPRKEKAARHEIVGCPLNSPTQHGMDTQVYTKKNGFKTSFCIVYSNKTLVEIRARVLMFPNKVA